MTGKSEQELASALHRLLHELGFGERLAQEGRRYIAEYHDWKCITQVLESALLQLVGSEITREAV
ncbi:MAG: glycosyltransferase [Bryobacteraceae bacterium]